MCGPKGDVSIWRWSDTTRSGVHGHFDHRFNRPWVSIDDLVTAASARVVGAVLLKRAMLMAGAKESEVAILNSLTVNLHLLMATFYKPTATRFKILLEDHAFPSDNVRFSF
jgi:kynureninase